MSSTRRAVAYSRNQNTISFDDKSQITSTDKPSHLSSWSSIIEDTATTWLDALSRQDKLKEQELNALEDFMREVHIAQLAIDGDQRQKGENKERAEGLRKQYKQLDGYKEQFETK